MKLRVTVNGKPYEVEVEVLDASPGTALPAPAAPQVLPAPAREPSAPLPPPAPRGPAAPSPSGAKDARSPIAGNVLKVLVSVGDQVNVNSPIVVLEAMKMETNVASPVAGKVKAVHVAAGQTVSVGQVLVDFE